MCTDMLITTVLTFFVIRYGWKYPLWLCLGPLAFSSWWIGLLGLQMFKLFEGGWFPLAIGGRCSC